MQTTLMNTRGGQASTSCPTHTPVAVLPRNKRVMQRSLKRQGLVVTAFARVGAPIPARPKADDKEEELPLWQQSTESAVDDHRLRNPLQRMERMGTGWFGVICEYEGVLVQDTHDKHVEAWKRVSQECDLPRPLGHTFRRIKGVRDDVVVKRIFNWTQNPAMAMQIAQRKAQVYDQLLEGRQPAEMLEARQFLELLRKYSIPVALACALPSERLESGLTRTNLAKHFNAVVTAEDSGAQEVEYIYSFASQRIQRPPIRCVVVGESNTSVEAAHELGMKCIVVTGNKPVYDYSSADLVVRDLSYINMFNLKRLFSEEDLVQSRLVEEEEEEEDLDSESLDAQLADLDSGFDNNSPMDSMLATM
ncbi:HAD-like domain-containing protein [Dunaliella salina]|uniref:HAD-like domain-containing protein n=1 Tax=Dunaliella salina TaxID=3046 RepID=A0ABQ7GSG6_DUNSA|nr:HAD-like domain-containing protein [Dunaliella salina]|eukprot:KAF5837530.1 HAD-like domain-containing protein [Dunaliella salina]